MPRAALPRVFHRMRAPPRHLRDSAERTRPGRDPTGVPVLDVIYLAATLALFALVGLIARGADHL
jgi:hypothetical protein